jgi:DNA-binding GntR family transcriptional regulator
MPSGGSQQPLHAFWGRGQQRQALAEHLSIIEAIAAGDADGAQQAALVHMRNARQARILALTEML